MSIGERASDLLVVGSPGLQDPRNLSYGPMRAELCCEGGTVCGGCWVKMRWQVVYFLGMLVHASSRYNSPLGGRQVDAFKTCNKCCLWKLEGQCLCQRAYISITRLRLNSSSSPTSRTAYKAPAGPAWTETLRYNGRGEIGKYTPGLFGTNW